MRLYIMQNSIVESATFASFIIDSDQTHLWHMRLSQMSERVLAELNE